MKKIFLLLVSALALSSCNFETIKTDGSNAKHDSGVPFDYVTEFSYKGHKYIKFEEIGDCGVGGVVHDPSCSCNTSGTTPTDY